MEHIRRAKPHPKMLSINYSTQNLIMSRPPFTLSYLRPYISPIYKWDNSNIKQCFCITGILLPACRTFWTHPNHRINYKIPNIKRRPTIFSYFLIKECDSVICIVTVSSFPDGYSIRKIAL